MAVRAQLQTRGAHLRALPSQKSTVIPKNPPRDIGVSDRTARRNDAIEKRAVERPVPLGGSLVWPIQGDLTSIYDAATAQRFSLADHDSSKCLVANGRRNHDQ
jgi:hypothetical protein